VSDLQDTPAARLALRVGRPEFTAARDALGEHVEQGRIDSAEFERRMEAVKATTTQGELLRVFADLPAPHPDLPGLPPPLLLRPSGDGGPDDMPLYGVACVLAMLLGEPVAVVLGIVYGWWWSLAVPVAFCVLLVTTIGVIERFRRR
jgi:hypothetical protein